MSVAFSIMLVFHAFGLPDSSLACRSDFFGEEHCMIMPPRMIKSSFLFIVVIIWCMPAYAFDDESLKRLQKILRWGIFATKTPSFCHEDAKTQWFTKVE